MELFIVILRLSIPRTRWANVQETATSPRSSGLFASSWTLTSRSATSKKSALRFSRYVTVAYHCFIVIFFFMVMFSFDASNNS